MSLYNPLNSLSNGANKSFMFFLLWLKVKLGGYVALTKLLEQ